MTEVGGFDGLKLTLGYRNQGHVRSRQCNILRARYHSWHVSHCSSALFAYELRRSTNGEGASERPIIRKISIEEIEFDIVSDIVT